MVKKTSRIRKTTPVDVILYIFIGALACITLLPFLNVIAISLSSYGEVASSTAMLWPREFTLSAYTAVFSEKVLVSFLWTVFVCVVSSVLHVLVCLLTAYPLSKLDLPGRKGILLFVLIPMLFGGGLVPQYQVLRALGYVDDWKVFIIPGLVSTYNIFLMRNFIHQIPSSIEEAARIDGAGYFRILFQMILPLSKPIISCLLLFFFVGKWNDWFTGVIYINNATELYPLQTVLHEILTAGNTNNITGMITSQQAYPESTKMAITIFSILPIACIYPFLQKYFEKGVYIGSVKG